MKVRLSRKYLACGLAIALGVIGLQSGRYLDMRDLRIAGTMLASLSFVALALSSGAYRTRFGMCLLLGLLCCATGDFVGPSNFTAGVWAFLIAHLALILATTQVPKSLRLGFWGAVVALPVSLAFVAFAWPHVAAAERMPVFAYTVVITAMVVATAAAAKTHPILFLGGAVFYVSDIFVSLWRYEGSQIYSYLCYPLYYFACYLLALSAAQEPVTEFEEVGPETGIGAAEISTDAQERVAP